jgi:hypothetical protein
MISQTALLMNLVLGLGFTAGRTACDSVIGAQPGVTEQINKTVTLSPGANVTVRGMNGRVSIDTSDTDRAEINITIRASDRESLERYPVVVEHAANSLVIRTNKKSEGGRWGRDRGWVRHEVRLNLPKNINLKVASINGTVSVGPITGEVGVSSVNGKVDVAQAGTATELSSINGRVVISLLRLGEGGLRASSINGGLEIGLPSATNAALEINSINGGIDSDLPITVLGEMKRGQLRGAIGSGGPIINISSVNGGVNLKRN